MKHKSITVERTYVQLYVYAVLMCPRIHHMHTVWQDPIMQVYSDFHRTGTTGNLSLIVTETIGCRN